jgi:broad specificity phosphatase PhoE
MTIFLIRHGQSELNRLNKVHGLNEPGLSGEGKAQAEQVAKTLAQEKIDLVYTSPLLRAKQTAQVIASVCDIPIKELDGLREIILGVWEGKSFEEISQLFKKDYQIWLKRPSRAKIAKAEKINSFRKRVVLAFKTMLKNNMDKNIAIVTHNGVIAIFLSYIFKADFDKLFHLISINNASISRIHFESGKFTISSVNDTYHLLKIRSPDDKFAGVPTSPIRE